MGYAILWGNAVFTPYSAFYLFNVVVLNAHSMLRLQVALVTNNFEGGKC